MTGLEPGAGKLLDMDLAEAIYLVAALLWIGAALGAVAVLVIVAVKLRSRRRRINRLLDVVRVPARLYAGSVRTQMRWEPWLSAQPRNRRRGAGSGPRRRRR